MLDTLNQNFGVQWRPDPRYYMTRLFAGMYPHRIADGTRLALYAVPDENNVAIAANGTYEGTVILPPGSHLYAIAATQSTADGFDLQIRNAATQATLFGRRIFYANASGLVVPGAAPASPLFFLPRPLLILDPGQIVVQIWNKSAAVNTVQVVLFCQIAQEPS